MQPDLNIIYKDIMDGQKELAQQIGELKEQIAEFRTKFDPVEKVYNSISGFGVILKFIFQYVIIPLSVMIGIILTYKQIKQ